MLTKKNIAIIMGGFSNEYEISLKSGNVVYEMLDTMQNIIGIVFTYLKINGYM